MHTAIVRYRLDIKCRMIDVHEKIPGSQNLPRKQCLQTLAQNRASFEFQLLSLITPVT